MQVPARQTLPQQPAAGEELSGQVMRVRARLLEKARMQARRAVWGPTVKAWLVTQRRRPPPEGSPTEAKGQGSAGRGCPARPHDHWPASGSANHDSEQGRFYFCLWFRVPRHRVFDFQHQSFPPRARFWKEGLDSEPDRTSSRNDRGHQHHRRVRRPLSDLPGRHGQPPWGRM